MKTRFEGHHIDLHRGEEHETKVEIWSADTEHVATVRGSLIPRSIVMGKTADLFVAAPDLLRVACELAEALELRARARDQSQSGKALAAFHALVDVPKEGSK